MTWREINKAVMERYPVTDRERGCASEKRKRDELRALARQRIENESQRKEKICETQGTDKQEI